MLANLLPHLRLIQHASPVRQTAWRTSSSLSCWIVCGAILLGPAGLPTAFAQDQTKETNVPMVPLAAPGPGQKALAIVPDEERDILKPLCQQLRLPLDTLGDFDANRRDYRNYHVMIVGSNIMDFFGRPETKVPQAFQPVVDFVVGGGHLIMFATYHGRNMEHMERFDISTGDSEHRGFLRVPVVSDAFFAGSEKFLPKDNGPEFMGRFAVKRPHVVLIEMSDGNPGAATTPFGDGRVTIVMVEPFHKKDFWLFPVMLNWHLRGAPTRLVTSGMFGVPALAKGIRFPVPDEEEVAKQRTTLQAELDADYRRIRPWNATIAKELARKLLARVNNADDSTECYAILTEARDLAAKSGDSATVLNATEICGQAYQIDTLSVLNEALSISSSASRSPGDSRTTFEVAMMGAREALALQQFDVADELLELAAGNAKRSRIADLPKQVTAMKQGVTNARKKAGK